MIPALGMVILPQNPSTENGHVPCCSCIISVDSNTQGENQHYNLSNTITIIVLSFSRIIMNTKVQSETSKPRDRTGLPVGVWLGAIPENKITVTLQPGSIVAIITCAAQWVNTIRLRSAT